MFPRTPPISLGNGTLTRSVFTAEGSLSAIFTHITGVKRGRLHNEVQRIMAAGTKMPSESRKGRSLSQSPLRYQGWSQRLTSQLILYSGALTVSHLKLCKTCQNNCGESTKHSQNEFVNHKLFFICFIHKRTIEFLWHPETVLIKIPTNQFIHLSIPWLGKPLMFPLMQLSILTQENFLLAYWSAILPSDSSQLIMIDSAMAVLVRQHRVKMAC